jgi:copper oxidase (laccase) domain-containing protein
MWLRKEKERKIWFEFQLEGARIIQGTKFYNPLEEIKIPSFGLKQIHSSIVVEASSGDEPVGDCIFTKRVGEFIYVKTADCLPLAFFNKKYRILGIVHTGWRGTYLKITENFIKKFFFERGIKPDEWEVVFGECIDYKDYEIGNDVVKLFRGKEGLVEENGKFYLDLVKSNIETLKKFGVKNIHLFPETDKNLFFSHRKGERGRKS